MSGYENIVAMVKDSLEAIFLKKTSIQDNLITDDATKVLSAKQGKILQDNKSNNGHAHSLSDINNVSNVAVVVTYTDSTTETLNLLQYTE